MKKQAFTLIELLVVITIIAIIAAILFPVFSSARDKARQTECLSNMKQLGLGFAQYNQDYDDNMPNGGNPSGAGNGWAGELYPYIKALGVFACPSDVTADLYPVCSYGYNQNIVTKAGGLIYKDKGTNGQPLGRNLSIFVAPDKTVLLFEVANNGATYPFSYSLSGQQYAANGDIYPTGTGTYDGLSPAGLGIGNVEYELNGRGATATSPTLAYATGYMQNSAQGTIYFLSPLGRHSGGSNFLMADSHARWLPGDEVSAGQTYGIWSYDPAPSTRANPCQPLSWETDAASVTCSSVAATFSTN